MEAILINIALTIFVGFLIGGFVYLISKSFKTPKERTIQIITRFGKFYAAIMSVEGYRLNNPHKISSFKENFPEWEIIPTEKDYIPGLLEEWNIYFFLWPIFKTYVYPFSYTKLKKRGDIQKGDIVIWSDEKTGESVISRKGISDHIDFQVEYPTITGNLFTNEMGKVLVFTNNTLRATNPFKMLFRINNWLGITTETIGAALRGVVGKLSIQQLNQIISEGAEAESSDFTRSMVWINTGKDAVQDGIEELWGARLVKSIFKSFTPADEKTATLMESFLQPKIAEQEGSAKVIKATKDGEAQVVTATKEGEAKVVTATRQAEAYAKEQAVKVEWQKKWLVDTGLAKTDASGNIIELVPDANTKISAEALKELSKLSGTLVLGENLNTMLGIKQGGA